MKRNLFGSLLCTGLVGITLTGERCPDWRNQTASQLKISNTGVLQSLLAKSGRELLGGGNYAMREGYVFRYQTNQGRQLVYAVGEQTLGLTPKIYTETRPATGVTVTAIAKTEDGVLEISSGYKLDVKKNQLSIIREIRNVSTEPVTLLLAQNYVDPRLFSDPETNDQLSIKMQPSVDGEAGPVPFPLDQVGYSRTLELKYFLSKGRGMIIGPLIWSDGDCGEGGCPPPPPCPVCLQLADLAKVCDLCQQVAGSDEEQCCEKISSEKISSEKVSSEIGRPKARIYSTRVGQGGQIVYYDAAVSFLETARLKLSPLESAQKSRAYLIMQIKLPAKFK